MAQQKLKFVDLKVGLTVLVGLIIFTFFLITIGSQINLFSDTYELKAFKESTGGISEGAMVTLGGMKVGSIKSIDFSERSNKNGVDFVLSIKKEHRDLITRSSKITTETKGLVGDKFINITMGKKNETPVEEGTYLPVKESFGISQMAAKLEPAMDNMQEISGNLKTLTEKLNNKESLVGKLLNDRETSEDFSRVVNNLERLTASLGSKTGTLGKLINDDSLYHNLNRMSDDFASIGKNLNNGEGTLGKLLRDDEMYNNLNNISERIDNLLAKTENDSALAGALLNDEKLYMDVRKLLISVDSLTNDLKKNPGRYVKFSLF